jgi:hypothetical protein
VSWSKECDDLINRQESVAQSQNKSKVADNIVISGESGDHGVEIDITKLRSLFRLKCSYCESEDCIFEENSKVKGKFRSVSDGSSSLS